MSYSSSQMISIKVKVSVNLTHSFSTLFYVSHQHLTSQPQQEISLIVLADVFTFCLIDSLFSLPNMTITLLTLRFYSGLQINLTFPTTYCYSTATKKEKRVKTTLMMYFMEYEKSRIHFILKGKIFVSGSKYSSFFPRKEEKSRYGGVLYM